MIDVEGIGEYMLDSMGFCQGINGDMDISRPHNYCVLGVFSNAYGEVIDRLNIVCKQLLSLSTNNRPRLSTRRGR